jgi:hypothetical protein
MGFTTRFMFLLGAGATTLVWACTSPTSKENGDSSIPTGDDSGSGDDTSSGSDDGSGGPGDDTGSGGGDYCTPDKPYNPVTWAPPTPLGQKLCTDQQEIDYLRAYKKDATAAFRADPANATCLSCIETPESASMHGPVIVTSTRREANYGGCVAIEDGDTSATGCGAILDGYNNCAIQECGDCKDYTIPPYTQTKMCLDPAVAVGGKCHAVDTTTTCQKELEDGGVALLCNTLDGFLAKWCAGKAPTPDGGSPDGT